MQFQRRSTDETPGGMSARLLIVLVSTAVSVLGYVTVPEPTPAILHLTFEANVGINADGQTVAAIQIQNTGTATFPASRGLNGIMEIRDEQGNLRVRAEAPRLDGPLSPGDFVFPIGWCGTLSPGLHELVWQTREYGSTLVKFEIVEHAGKLSLERRSTQSNSKDKPAAPPKENDYGKATPLVEQAKTDLGKRLGISVNGIRVRSVEWFEFSDSSLGMAEPGKAHPPVATPGYVIRLVAGSSLFEFRADDRHVVFVPVDSWMPCSINPTIQNKE